MPRPQSGEVVIQQRHHSKALNPGCWTASASGHVGSGQTSYSAAIQVRFYRCCEFSYFKELGEELGIWIAEHGGSLQYQFSFFRQRLRNDGAEICFLCTLNLIISGKFVDNEFVDVYIYEMPHVEPDLLRIQPTEVAAARLIHFSDLHYAVI